MDIAASEFYNKEDRLEPLEDLGLVTRSEHD